MMQKFKMDKSGFVFVTVIMIIAVMAIITLSVISLNSSQTINVEKEVKRIQAEALGIGVAQALLMDPDIGTSVTFDQTMDGTDFTVLDAVTDDNLGPFGTDTLEVQIQY